MYKKGGGYLVIAIDCSKVYNAFEIVRSFDVLGGEGFAVTAFKKESKGKDNMIGTRSEQRVKGEWEREGEREDTCA